MKCMYKQQGYIYPIYQYHLDSGEVINYGVLNCWQKPKWRQLADAYTLGVDGAIPLEKHWQTEMSRLDQQFIPEQLR